MGENMAQVSTAWIVVFWVSLGVSSVIGFLYFRALGDVTQFVFKVKRESMLTFVRHEYKIIVPGVLAAGLAAFVHFAQGASSSTARQTSIELNPTEPVPSTENRRALCTSPRSSTLDRISGGCWLIRC